MTSLQHVTLELRRDQVPACLAFYGLLGFRAVEAPPALADRAAWLQAGATQIHLMWVEEPVVMPRGHIAVLLEDYEGVLAALAEAAHETESRAEHWGARRSYARDPAGHLVELMAAPPPGAAN